MKALILSYRRGRHTQNTRQMLIKVEGLDVEGASKLIGKEVVWRSKGGKEIKGKISSLHGRKGVLRVIFERGLPGQAIGTEVEIL
ncbi:MAG: 50S ribosomal protein L35ae [Nanoarchaeota archaeon]|nr:50S ribosomal protein L35ae [Nanoarchaeota archaeon]